MTAVTTKAIYSEQWDTTPGTWYYSSVETYTETVMNGQFTKTIQTIVTTSTTAQAYESQITGTLTSYSTYTTTRVYVSFTECSSLTMALS